MNNLQVGSHEEKFTAIWRNLWKKIWKHRKNDEIKTFLLRYKLLGK